MPVAARNLHRRCDYREVEYEDMMDEYVYKTMCYAIDETLDCLRRIALSFEKIANAYDMSQPSIECGEIQHVGYSQEACGYEK